MYNQITLYTPRAVAGVSALVTASSLSLLSAAGTLLAIFLTTTRPISSVKTNPPTSTSTAPSSFTRSPLGAYIISLLFAELIQSAASLFSIKWLLHHGVFPSPICSLQGALKNAGNVSTAIWSLVIALHTFALIFLKLRIPHWVFWATILGGWGLVGFVVLLGPTVIQNVAKGPFWGVSGYWCWIAPTYTVEQFAMEYLFMLITAITSLILYTLIFFRLRGNILYSSQSWYRLSFHRTSSPWARNTSLGDPQIERVGKSMLLYPLCYVALVLPIAICRWSESFGASIPFEWTIAADFIFLCSGVVNALLYCLTRRVPVSTPRLPSLLASNRKRNNSGDGIRADESFQVGKATTIRTIDSEATLIVENDLITDKGGTRDYAYWSSGDTEKANMMGYVSGRTVDVQVDNEMQSWIASKLDPFETVSGLPTIPPPIHTRPHVLPHTTSKEITPSLTLAASINARISNPESIASPTPTPLGPAPARRSFLNTLPPTNPAARISTSTRKLPGSTTAPTPAPMAPTTIYGTNPDLSTSPLTRNLTTSPTHSDFNSSVCSKRSSVSAPSIISSYMSISGDDVDANMERSRGTDEDVNLGRELSSRTFGPPIKKGIRKSLSLTYSQPYTISPASKGSGYSTTNSHSSPSGSHLHLQDRLSRSPSMASNSDSVSVNSSWTFDSSRPPRHRVDVPRPHPFSYIGVGDMDLAAVEGYEE